MKTGGKPVYRYLYARPRPPYLGMPGQAPSPAPTAPAVPAGPLGAVHSAEIQYAMGNLDLDKRYSWEPADYTVASGIFNLRADLSDTAWMAYILETLGHMNAASRKGFSFNILTKYSDADRMRPELYYADPCFFFDYCKRTFSRDVALRHDYREYDFTMIVRK